MYQRLISGLARQLYQCTSELLRSPICVRELDSGVNLTESTFFPPFSLFWSGAVSVSPCVNQYFEVKEGERTNRLICRGLTSQDTVSWFAKNSSAGSCPPLSAGSSSDSCTPTSGNFGEVFHPSRTSNAESVLNVDPVVHGSAVVEGGSLECQIAGGNGPYPSCQMDYVCEFSNGSRLDFHM